MKGRLQIHVCSTVSIISRMSGIIQMVHWCKKNWRGKSCHDSDKSWPVLSYEGSDHIAKRFIRLLLTRRG